MNRLARVATIVVAFTLVSAAVGGWLGVRYGMRSSNPPQGLDELLHANLNLSAVQEGQLVSLEAQYAARRGECEERMRAANREIGRAVTERHQFDAEAKAALDRLHQAMMELQALTVEHVLAMRTVLTEPQQRRFDEVVSRALSAGEP